MSLLAVLSFHSDQALGLKLMREALAIETWEAPDRGQMWANLAVISVTPELRSQFFGRLNDGADVTVVGVCAACRSVWRPRCRPT